MRRRSLTTATIFLVVLAVAAAGWLAARTDVDDPDGSAGPSAAVRLRWTNESHRGRLPDLVVIMGDDFSARIEGSLRRYHVGDQRIRCHEADGVLDCALDPGEGALVPSAGTTDLAALDGQTRQVAGREARCWSFEASAGEIHNCADSATGVPVLTETRAADSSTWSRQELAEWSPASAADLTLPPEATALLD